MKKLLFALTLALATSFTLPAFAKAEVKEVCKEVVKKGKKVQECKKVKKHKKVDGTKVPEKAPNKKKK